MGISLRHTSNVTIENSNINGLNTGANRLMVGIKDIYGDDTGTIVQNNNIPRPRPPSRSTPAPSRTTTSHQPGMVTGDHINGITTNGDTSRLLIQNNTILNKFIQTDAIGLFQDFCIVSNVTINDNFLAGGGYTIYGGNGSNGQTSNIVVTNNTISTMYFPNGGHCGPVAYFDDRGPATPGPATPRPPARPSPNPNPPTNHSATRPKAGGTAMSGAGNRLLTADPVPVIVTQSR